MREGLDVRRGEAELAAALGAADDDALDAVRPAEDLARALDIALGDEAPCEGRGERLAAARLTGHEEVDDLDLEVVRLPCSRRNPTLPAALWPKRKLGPSTTALACSLSTSTLTTKSAGDSFENSVVNGTMSRASTPSSAISSARR